MQRGFLDVVGDQFAHTGVALGSARTAHDHGNQATTVAMQRGEQIEARGGGKSGLDAVDAFDLAQKVVVTADGFAVKFECLR